MARRRDYAAEYRARSERARRLHGFTGYSHYERERRRLRDIEAHPSRELRTGFRRPGEWKESEEPPGIQGPSSPSPDLDPTSRVPDWDYYWPTRTINPPRPRTLQARYSARRERIEVIFRDGSPASPDATWHYDEVTPNVWTAFKRAESPGRFINSTLNYFPMGAGGWGTIVGE